MKKHRFYSVIIVWCCLLTSSFTSARNLFENGPLNAYTHLTIAARTDSNSVLIKQGVRAFYINNSTQFKSVLTDCEKANKTTNEIFYFVVPSHTEQYLSVLKQRKLLAKLFLGSSQPYPTEKALLAQGKNYVLILLSDPESKSEYPLKAQKHSRLNRQSNRPAFFYACTFTDSTNLKNQLQSFWDLNAHPMNFVIVPENQFQTLEPIVQQLNQKQRISGMYLNNEKAFQYVEITENKMSYPSAYFCYPFKGFTINLTPYKEGYFFSPDAITSNYTMAYKFFRIKAHRLEKNYLRILKLNFDTPDSTNAIYNFLKEGIDITNSTGSNTARFGGSGSQISFLPQLQPDSLLNFSAAFRIKLNSKERFQSILSMGKTFCLKIADGRPSFNVYVNTFYKDDNSLIDTAKWYHMAFVVSKGRVFKLYVNGQKTFQDSIQRIGATNEVMQLGNNSQYEPFIGEMDDIQLWNRTLGDEDIKELYAEKTNSAFPLFPLSIILATAVLSILLVIILRKKRKQKIIPTQSTEIKLASNTTCNAIYFFGKMRIYSRDGKELSADMSPKLKLLFIILCFETIANESGISTKDLTDILWPGMSEANAKNNRSPYIHKLRTLLAQMDGVELVFQGKNWKLKFSSVIWCDYLQFLHVKQAMTLQLKNQELKLDDHFISTFPKLIAGNLLDKMEHEYVDTIRAKTTDDILQLINTLSEHEDLVNDANKLLMLAEVVFNIDELNEDALQLQLKAYKLMNNQSMIRISKENFSKKYQNSYNQPYIFDEKDD